MPQRSPMENCRSLFWLLASRFVFMFASAFDGQRAAFRPRLRAPAVVPGSNLNTN